MPEECSVIGFDDIMPAALCTPPLSTVRQPMEAMGAAAVSVVLDGINAATEHREVPAVYRKMPSELVLRESTRPIS